MNVLQGPRREVRRVIYNGAKHWADHEDGALRLADGRRGQLDHSTRKLQIESLFLKTHRGKT